MKSLSWGKFITSIHDRKEYFQELMTLQAHRQLVFLMNEEKAEAMGSEERKAKSRNKTLLLSGDIGHVFLT